jgi:SAM-dependent methyltransferase
MSKSWREALRNYYEMEYPGVILDSQTLVDELLDEHKDFERVEVLIAELGLDKSSRILEGGSGAGGTLLALLKLGYDAYGVEPDPILFKIAFERLEEIGAQNRIRREAVGDSSFQNSYFHNFFSFQVLEHVQDQERFFTDVHRLLAPEGKIFVAVPNYRFIWEPHYAMIFPLFLGKSIFGLYLRIRRRNPNYLNSLNFVNPRVLKSLCRRNGFEILGLGTDTYLDRIRTVNAPTYGRTSNLLKLFKLFLRFPPMRLVAISMARLGFYYPIYLLAKRSEN